MCGGEKRPFLVTRKKESPFIDAVHKGCWEKFAVALCAKNGVALDFSHRPPPSLKKRVTEFLKAAAFKIFPINWIVRVQNAVTPAS